MYLIEIIKGTIKNRICISIKMNIEKINKDKKFKTKFIITVL